jgi:hypothetical protein
MTEFDHLSTDEMIEMLRGTVGMRQLAAGYPAEFRTGDLVQFPLGLAHVREQDYRVTRVRADGVVVATAAGSRFEYPVPDEAVIRLGMVHSPNQP